MEFRGSSTVFHDGLQAAASFASLFTFVFSRGGVGHPIIFSHCQKQWETRRTDLSAAGGIADIEVATDLLASPPHH